MSKEKNYNNKEFERFCNIRTKVLNKNAPQKKLARGDQMLFMTKDHSKNI